MDPKVSVIIPTYNRVQMVSDCVASVLATDWPDLEVIVVDDCSPDDTRGELKRRFPGDGRVVCVRNATNLMTTGSRNRGAAEAHGDYLLFLDHDNRLRPTAIAELVAAFDRHPDAVLVGAVSINLEKKGPPAVWSLGSDFNRWTSRPVERYAGVPERDLPALPDDLPTTYAPNAFMVRRAAFAAVGGFDPAIGMMFDESDFGWRLLKRLGGSAWFATRARTDHCGHVDPLVEETPLRRLGIEKPRRAFCFARNRLRFARRHFSPLQVLSVALVFAPLSAAYYGLVALRNGRPGIAWAYFCGTLAGIFSGRVRPLTGATANTTPSASRA